MSEKNINELIDQFEREGRFWEELTPPDTSASQPVTVDYPYIRKGFFKKCDIFFKRLFIINPFIRKNNKALKTIVVGKENLKGIKNGIVTSNHVHIFDCFAIKKALNPKRAKFVVAEFNVKTDNIVHKMMQVEGILPLSKNLSVMRKFDEAVEYYLQKNQFVAIYPEQCMWPMYEKPRPYKNGAFKYAVKHNVPVIPMFITFRNSGVFDKNGNEQKYFTVNVMPPLYPNHELSPKEQEHDLMKRNYEACVNKYEEVYNKKMEYLTKE